MGGKKAREAGSEGGFRCPAPPSSTGRPSLAGRGCSLGVRAESCPLSLQLRWGSRPALPLPGGPRLSCRQRSSPSAWPGPFPAWRSVPLHQAKVSRSSRAGAPGRASSRHIPGTPPPCPENHQCWRGNGAFQGGGCCSLRLWVHPQRQHTWLSLHLGVTPIPRLLETPTISAQAVPHPPRAEWPNPWGLGWEALGIGRVRVAAHQGRPP